MDNKLAAIIIVLLVVGVGYFWYQSTQEEIDLTENNNVVQNEDVNTTTVDTGDDTTTTEVREGVEWKLFTTTSFSFSYPESARTNTEDGKIQVEYEGVDSEEGVGEVTDGFVFIVEAEEITETTSLEEFAEDKYDEDSSVMETVEEIDETEIGERIAYRYKVETPNGDESVRMVIESDQNQNSVFIVHYTVADPNDLGYESLIENMIETLEIN